MVTSPQSAGFLQFKPFIHMGIFPPAAHFLLTELLLPVMKQTAKDTGVQGRIVIVASSGHDLTYPQGIRFDKLDSEEG